MNKPPVIRRRAYWIVLAGLLFMAGAGVGIAGYFRLGSESRTLRQSVMNSVGAHWHKKVALNAGWATMGVVRWATSWLPLPPEARTVLDSVRHAEVGIYDMVGDEPDINSAATLRAMDSAVNLRGWERIVGAVHDHKLVAIYMPKDGVSMSKIDCCVVVLHGNQLVVVAAGGNPQKLFTLASRRLESKSKLRQLAQK